MTTADLEPRGTTTLAIIGIGLRWPGGVKTCDGLVEFLDAHGDGIVDVPADRWNSGRFYSADKSAVNRSYVNRAGFLQESVFEMDPAPFHLSPRECAQLDPQQRVLLETSWDAIEDAGIPVEKLKGSRTGIYVGGFMLDARDIISFPENRSLIGGQTATAMGNTVLSNRLSYTYDLCGPSMTVDTACSSSLVTIHLACRDLVDGSCDLALAGGVNVMISPLSTLLMCKGQFLAADGRSKTFDAAADGYGRGEGAGLVVLKRLADAERDGDRIYATILATGVNQDGRTDGMPLPNGDAQESLSREVSRKAGIDPKRLGYVEAHGTGTKAGDTTEVAALSKVYAGAGRATPLAIGSIKTNIGHTEAAAGVAGLIKAALSLHHRKIFPLRALGEANPAIDFDGLGIRIPLTSEAWPKDADLTAAVNSFGYGGTNAHAILGASPTHTTASADASTGRSGRIFIPISAYDEQALKQRAQDLAPLALSNVEGLASTLAHHRAQLSQRAVIIADSAEDAHSALLALAAGTPTPNSARDRADINKLCCVYTGMGPQWWGMGRELFQTEAVFRNAAEEIDALFTPFSGWSLIEEMLRLEEDSKIARNRVAQPANFLLQASLTQLYWSRGVHFDAYLGHSVGELTAAWATGCLSLQDAVFAAFHRSDLQEQVAGKGTMLAVGLSPEEGAAICKGKEDVSIAAINGPKSIALAGRRSELVQIAEQLEEQGIFAQIMRVDVAYHSPHMDPLQDGFFSRLASLSPMAPASQLFSTALGSEVTGAIHDADYWWKNARQPVLLAQALESALKAGCDGFVEVGPHPVLTPAILGAGRQHGGNVTCIASLRRKEDQSFAFDRSLASLHCAGIAADWESLAPRRERLALPPYPFQRKLHWEESASAQAFRLGRPGAHPFLDQKESASGQSWKTELDDNRFAWLEGHQIQGARVFPAAGYLEIGLAVSSEQHGSRPEVVLEDIRLENALVLPDHELAKLSVELRGEDLTIHSDVGGGYQKNASMRIPERASYAPLGSVNLLSFVQGLEELDVDEGYAALERAGLHYTDKFRALKRLFKGKHQIVAEIAPEESEEYLLFPASLDAAFQALLASSPLEQAMVPTRIERLRFVRSTNQTLFAVCTLHPSGADNTFNVQLFDEAGASVALVEGLHCDYVDKAGPLRGAELGWLYRRSWEERKTVLISNSERPLILSGGDSDAIGSLAGLLQQAGQATCLAGTEEPLLPHHVFVVSGREDELGETASLELMQLASRLTAGARLTVVTHGAYAISGEESQPSCAAVCGVARVILSERPELQTQVVDLPLAEGVDAALVLAAILSHDEEECTLRGGKRLASRIVRAQSSEAEKRSETRPPEVDESCELFAPKPGVIDALAYRPRLYESEIGDDEVEIEVECASLNFKDLMKVMGLLGEMALHRTYLGKKLGIEAAGRALRVGKNVSHIQPGQLVVGFFGGALATKVRAAGHLTVAASPVQSAATASTLLVFATAWHGLVQRARLAPGERVLIHAATGGVGLAAIQVAQHLGAEIYATAGQEKKREYLRSMGIRHVYDSRTLDYADAIRRDTGEKGVDVVLNSLAGEHLLRSLDLLSPGGRFVELGKQDFSENTKLGLLPFNRALTMHAVDLDRMSLEQPDLFRPLAEEVCRAFDEGILSPLPSEVFSASDVSAAFRRLGDADRMGKIVIDFSEGVPEVLPGWTEATFVRPNRSYLVTGGLSGFGLRTAQWLADCGAGEIVLASRKGTLDREGEARVAVMRQQDGCTVRCVKLDVTDPKAVRELVHELSQGKRPLAGIFHAAAVLDDRPLEKVDAPSLRQVLGPKAGGAWNLHLASTDLALDHFVLFSSISSLIGNPGQASYAAANSFLDGLASLRRSRGLAGTSVSWGAIALVGMLARDKATGSHLQSIGFTPLKPARALEALRLGLSEDWSEFGIVAADWARWKRHTSRTPWQRLSAIKEESLKQSENPILAELRVAKEEDRLTIVQRLMRHAIAPIFKLGADDLDIDQPLRDLGLDSLIAVEVQAQVESRLGVELSSMEILSGRPVAALSALALSRLVLDEQENQGEETPEAASVHPSASEIPGDLRDYFLARICVQPPYFSFETVEQAGDWVHGLVRPDLLGGGSPTVLQIAEAGRHAAIMGSCAARLEHELSAGRIYYPVRSSRLLLWSGAPLTETVSARARCVAYDVKASSAVCETELRTLSGDLLCRFEVTYHVILAGDFREIFAAHQRPTNELTAPNPYQSQRDVSVAQQAIGIFEGQELIVAKDDCLGHFVDYPAYPVSIMLRDALLASHHALSVEHGDSLAWSLSGGTCETSRFIFAGEKAKIDVQRSSVEGRKEAWLCQIRSGSEVCARFAFEVVISSSDLSDLEHRRVIGKLRAV